MNQRFIPDPRFIPVNPMVDGIEYAIRDILKPAKELEAAGKEILYLNIGDPLAYDFSIPKHFRDAATYFIKKGDHGYSESIGIKALREAIVMKERKINQVVINDDRVMVTNGISEGIRFVLTAMLNPGDEILLPGPGYPPYQAIAHLLGAVPKSYELMEEDDWQPNLDDMRAKISPKTKAITLINPNNPTGAVFRRSVVKKIYDLAGEFNIPLITDEIYDQLVYGHEHTSVASQGNDVPVIGLNGLSKVYLVTGWRIGYIYFHGPARYTQDLQEVIAKQSRIRLCVATPLQQAAALAIRQQQTHLKKYKEQLIKRRNLLVTRLNEIPGISCKEPHGALYVFPKIDSGNWASDKEFVLQLLKQEGVLVVHGSGFDKVYGRKHFRAVFLPPFKILDQACDKINNFMK